jgi:AraC-like DNA-binding protein
VPLTPSIVARPDLGAALQIVQHGAHLLRRVWVESPALILVVAGRKRIRTALRTVSAGPGEIVAVAGGQELEVTNISPAGGPYEACCLAFSPALFDTVIPGARAGCVVGATTLTHPPEYFMAAMQRGLAACDPDQGPPPAIARHHLQEVLLGLGLLEVNFDVRNLGNAASQVRRLVGTDPAIGWKADAVAQTLGLSGPTLRRRLAAEQTTFRAVLRQVRMTHALCLLQSSNLPVAQIAYAAGYDSVSQFTTRFRSHFGQNPGALRGGPAR